MPEMWMAWEILTNINVFFFKNMKKNVSIRKNIFF